MNLMNMAAQALAEQAIKSLSAGKYGPLVQGLVGVVQQNGGAQGITTLVQQFEKNGLGQIVQSWVSTGQNMPVTPQQIEQGMGTAQVQQIATASGQTPQETSQQLATLLPQLIDTLTPGGKLDVNMIGQFLSALTQKKAA